MPVDIDVLTMDNSGTRKDGVSRTYAVIDGLAPIAANVGQEGWCLSLELRDGGWHAAKETTDTLERTLPRQGKTVLAGLTEQFSDVGARVFGHAQVIEDKPTVAGEALDGRSDAVSCL